MNPLPSRPTIAERLAAIDALLNQFDAALAEAARASAAIRAILAGEPRPPRYLTAEEAARHVAARLGATGDGDDDGPLFDGPVTTKAELDEAYDAAAPAAFPACVCGCPVTAHCDDGRDRVPCRKPGCTCPDYEIPADREHEILPAASTA